MTTENAGIPGAPMSNRCIHCGELATQNIRGFPACDGHAKYVSAGARSYVDANRVARETRRDATVTPLPTAPGDNDFPFARPDGSDASMFIQWKGTTVCLDFHCDCGADGHLDDSFAYFVECPSCGQQYEMGTQVIAKKVDAVEDGRARVLAVD